MVLRYLTMKLLVITITFVVEQPGMGWEKWRRMHWCHSKTLYDQNFFSSKCDFFLAHKSWGFGEPEVERNRICIWPSVWKSFRQKVLCRNVLGSIIHNIPKLETTGLFFCGQMDKQIWLHFHSGILFSKTNKNKTKKQLWYMPSMNESQKKKWLSKRSETKRSTYCMIPFMKFKNRQN